MTQVFWFARFSCSWGHLTSFTMMLLKRIWICDKLSFERMFFFWYKSWFDSFWQLFLIIMNDENYDDRKIINQIFVFPFSSTSNHLDVNIRLNILQSCYLLIISHLLRRYLHLDFFFYFHMTMFASVKYPKKKNSLFLKTINKKYWIRKRERKRERIDFTCFIS